MGGEHFVEYFLSCLFILASSYHLTSPSLEGDSIIAKHVENEPSEHKMDV